MEIEQLELDLWRSLETSAQFPQTADFPKLYAALEREIVEQPVRQQLQTAAEVFTVLSQIYAARVEELLSSWERRYNPTEPTVDLNDCVELFVQSLHLDVTDLFEPLEPVDYPENRRSRTTPTQDSSLAGEVDKAVLLEVLEREHELDDEAAKAEALAVAHSEDISAWVEAISQYFSSKQLKSISLVELAKKVKYPVVKGEKGSPLVKTWLALLLGRFVLEQKGDDFYEARDIQVKLL